MWDTTALNLKLSNTYEKRARHPNFQQPLSMEVSLSPLSSRLPRRAVGAADLPGASRGRNDTAKIAIDARPGGPTAKCQPSPEGLGNRSRRGSERRRRGTQPIVRSPCVIRSVLGKFAHLRSLCSILPVPTWCVRCDATPPRADRYTLDLCVATRAPR
jgi:hypothetical protein